MPLLPFIVLYTNETFTVPEVSLFVTEDSVHAEVQMLLESPDADVTWIVQTDNVDIAFDSYHHESTCEDNA